MFSYDENGVTKRYGIHRSCGQSGHLKKVVAEHDTPTNSLMFCY